MSLDTISGLMPNENSETRKEILRKKIGHVLLDRKFHENHIINDLNKAVLIQGFVDNGFKVDDSILPNTILYDLEHLSYEDILKKYRDKNDIKKSDENGESKNVA